MAHVIDNSNRPSICEVDSNNALVCVIKSFSTCVQAEKYAAKNDIVITGECKDWNF